MKHQLQKMQSYGTKKHDLENQAKKERQKAKSEGKSKEEIEKIDYLKEKIVGKGTMKTYIQQADNYADWLEENGMKKVSIEVAKYHVQEYLNHLVKEGYSPYSIHTAASACAKIFKTSLKDYNIPKRSVADIKKGKNPTKNDSYNQEHMKEELKANRLLGMRKTALSTLRAKDIIDYADMTVVRSKGKGGKHNVQMFFDADERKQVLDLKIGKNPMDYIFDKKKIKNSDADFHHERAMRAKDVYFRTIEDMREHPERRDYYKDIIERIFYEDGKKLPDNLDKLYVTRGKFRQMLIREGKDISYDRLALIFVSVTVLNHYREDVTVQNYVSK